MSNIPEDIRKAATKAYWAVIDNEPRIGGIKIVAAAVEAERERCARIVENSGEVSVHSDAREKLAALIRGEV